MNETTRILIVDDNPAIHADFRKILCPNKEYDGVLAEAEANLFGKASVTENIPAFELDDASQGEEALQLVRQALDKRRPYALAFMDVRMPPGWDGIETTLKLWELDPDLQIVICTAYSDYDWDEMTVRFGSTDRFVVLKKPFDSIEVRQLAHAFARKWQLQQQERQQVENVERAVISRTEEMLKSEARYRLLFEFSPVPTWVFDLESLKFLAVNNAAISNYGYTLEEFLSMTIKEIRSPDQVPDLLTELSSKTPIIVNGRLKRHQRKDGSEILVEITSHPVRFQDHEAQLVLAQDVTERRKAEEALKERLALQERLGKIATNAPGVLYAFRLRQNGSTSFPYCSPMAAEVLGVLPAEIASDAAPLFARIHRQDVDKVSQSIADSARTLAPWRQEFRLLHPRKGEIWVEAHSTPDREANGSVLWHGYASDITERRTAETELRWKTAFLEAQVEAAHDAILVVNREGKKILQNERLIELFKVPDEIVCDADDSKLLRHVVGQTRHPEQFKKRVAELYANPDEIGRDELELANGTILDRYSAPVRDKTGEYYGRIWSFRDITEQKRAVEKLRLQTSALEAAANGIVITDRGGVIRWVNPAFTQLTGYSAEDTLGRKSSLLKSGVHDQNFYEQMWKTILSGNVWHGELTNRRKDGSQYYEEMAITPVRADDGAISHFVAIKHDISERKEFEAVLAHERQLLHTLMENSPDAIYFKDLDSRFLRCSKTQALRFGVDRPEEVVGKTDFDFFEEEHARPAFEDEQRIIRTGQPIIGKAEKEVWKSDGRITWAFTTKMPLRNADGDIVGTFGISADITALKEAERQQQMMEVQLRHAQKLEAVGQLAAGIAHEINTPTQYVGDNTRFLKDSFESIAKVLESHRQLLQAAKANTLDAQAVASAEQALADGDLDYLFEQIPAAIRETLEGVERVTKIVRAMKEFSHPGGKEKTPTDLNKAIETTVTVARNEWKYVADLKLDLDPTLPPVPCFVGEFNQCMLNLVVNAAHAIGDVVKEKPGTKGTITVSTHQEQDQIEVRVRDTGTGIPEAVRSRIFEPFFTTKDVGKGTGQGLAIVYTNIVRKHGGTVHFETETGKGTVFILRLPINPPSENQVSATPETVPRPELAGVTT